MRLPVPYIPQQMDGSCGLASIDMIRAYYGLKPRSQQALFDNLKQPHPLHDGVMGIALPNLVALMLDEGLHADWWRASPKLEDSSSIIEVIRRHVEDFKAPILVCQRYGVNWPGLVHFRVVVGIDRKKILLHDPCPVWGGGYQPRRHRAFLEDWEAQDGSFVPYEAVTVRGFLPTIHEIAAPIIPRPAIHSASALLGSYEPAAAINALRPAGSTADAFSWSA